MKKLKYKISSLQLKAILDIIKELNKVFSEIVIKTEGDKIIFYTVLNESFKTTANAPSKSSVDVIKCYVYDIKQFIPDWDLKTNIHFEFSDAAKFVKSFSIFLDSENDLDLLLDYKEDSELVINFKIKNSFLEISCNGNNRRITTLTREVLKNNFSPSLALSDFVLSKADFDNIIKLSNLNKSSDTVTISVKDSKVNIYDINWNLSILGGTVNKNTPSISKMPKKYLSCVNSADLKCFVFENFIVITENKCITVCNFWLDVN